MSFLNKIGIGKKHDDFSLDTNPDPSFTTGLPPEPGSMPASSDPFAPPSDASLGLPPNPDPMANSMGMSTQPSFGQTPDPMQPSFSSTPPASDPFATSSNIPATPGQQMAHDYMQQTTASSQPAPKGDDMLELINVKLDAIRSEVANLGHRITQMEQKIGEKKRGF